MATSTQISIAEYLATVYRPDCEYIDGELLEKNMGKWGALPHSGPALSLARPA